ncbi:hypothetical protein [Streptomyces sp. NPDC094149]
MPECRSSSTCTPAPPHEFDSIGFTSDVARRAIADRVRVLKPL